MRKTPLCLLAGLFAFGPQAFAEDGHVHRDGCCSKETRLEAQAVEESPILSSPDREQAREYFTDTVLVNQDGQRLQFYSDLMDGKIVLINSFFTTCEGVCPVLIQRMVAVQDWLGDRLGDDVHMISITVDPLTDTPEVIKQYADEHGAKPGWHFLTGGKDSVDSVLRKLGQYVDVREAHSPVVLVGNLRTGYWKKVLGLADPQEVLTAIESVVNDPGA